MQGSDRSTNNRSNTVVVFGVVDGRQNSCLGVMTVDCQDIQNRRNGFQ